MGERDASNELDQERLRVFMKAVLTDVQALETMLGPAGAMLSGSLCCVGGLIFAAILGAVGGALFAAIKPD